MKMKASRLVIAGRAPLLSGSVNRLSWDPSELDLSNLTWATPFDVAAITVIWLQMASRSAAPVLMLPVDPTVRAYLVDMGLDTFLPGDWGHGGGSGGDPPWLRLTRLSTADQWDDMQSALWPVARKAFGNNELTLRTFEMLGELVDNAATHGRSEIGTLVCAQRYTGTKSGLQPGVWLGVADGGIGIPEHLRRNPRFSGEVHDKVLIGLARKAWVTGTAERRGWGLVEVFENAAAAGPSQVVIQSGRGEGDFRLRPSGRLWARYRVARSAVPGTWIHVRVESR